MYVVSIEIVHHCVFMKTAVDKKWLKIQIYFITTFNFEQPLLVAHGRNTTEPNTIGYS